MRLPCLLLALGFFASGTESGLHSQKSVEEPAPQQPRMLPELGEQACSASGIIHAVLAADARSPSL